MPLSRSTFRVPYCPDSTPFSSWEMSEKTRSIRPSLLTFSASTWTPDQMRSPRQRSSSTSSESTPATPKWECNQSSQKRLAICSRTSMSPIEPHQKTRESPRRRMVSQSPWDSSRLSSESLKPSQRFTWIQSYKLSTSKRPTGYSRFPRSMRLQVEWVQAKPLILLQNWRSLPKRSRKRWKEELLSELRSPTQNFNRKWCTDMKIKELSITPS